MQKKTAAILALAVLGTVLAVAASASAAAHGRAVVKLRTTTLGKVLVDAKGRTLYLYTPDGKSKSTCYGGCAKAWPPLLSTGKAKAAAGVKGKLLGLTMRTDGSHQVTYKGHPLYYYAGDSRAGQVNGEDVGGVWYALDAAGKQVESKSNSSSSATTTTTSSPGSGYGY